MPEGDGGYGGYVVNVPKVQGALTMTNSYEFLIDLAKTIYVNYNIVNPEYSAQRAISYASVFWAQMPESWRKYVENNRTEHLNNINHLVDTSPGNETP